MAAAAAADAAAAAAAAPRAELPAPAISRPTHADVPALLALINAAYDVETGDTGPAFKRTPRYDSADALTAAVAEGRVLVARRAADGALQGAIVYEVELPAVYFGPFAVAPAAQGAGVGRALLAALERVAHDAGASRLDITVVNVRCDILPMYAKLGFVATGTSPYPEPDTCTRPVHFINMSRPLPPAHT